MTYFAKTVRLDFDDSNGGANADKSPWVLIGGSYPGALSAWTQQIDPGVFWAYHASSAVVEAIYDFYMYFDAVEQAIPRNCSSDVKKVVSYIDQVFADGDQEKIGALQAYFGLPQLSHPDDFAYWVSYPLQQWQTEPASVFQFCDWIETSTSSGVVYDNGVGLDAALAAYASYINETISSHCGVEFDCDTYSNPGSYNDPTDFSGSRQWLWLLCHNPYVSLHNDLSPPA
jgi:hypothetical protein